MQPWRARTKRPRTDLQRVPSLYFNGTNSKTRYAKFTDTCNELEKTLKLEKEAVDSTEAATFLRAVAESEAKNSSGKFSNVRPQLAEHGKQAGNNNDNEEASLIARVHQTHVGNGYGADGFFHEACPFSYGAGAGELEPTATCCDDDFHGLLMGKIPSLILSREEYHDKGDDAHPSRAPSITVLRNEHGTGPIENSGVTASCQVPNNNVYGVTRTWRFRKAQQAFDTLSCQSKESPVSLIKGYIKHGDLYHALSLYHKLSEEEAFCLTRSTFVLLLKVCAKLKDLKTGTELHAKSSELGLHVKDAIIATCLVDMYAKCGSFAEARCVLERFCPRDVVAWTALITGYAEHGLAEEVIKCFETMQLEGVVPDRVLVVCVLRVCGSLGAMDKVQEIHIELERIGLLEKDMAIGTILIEIYASCNLLSRSQQVFDKLHQRDVISWTALILGYAEHGHSKEALKCFDLMQHEGILPDGVTYMCILKACTSLGALDRIQGLHVQIERVGLLRGDDIVGSVLVDAYGKIGALDKALQAFSQLRVRSVVPWTALIEGFAEHGHGEEALEFFGQMQVEGVLPNEITFSSGLKACGSVGAIVEGQKIHSQAARIGLLNSNLIVGNALVDMYAKCGVLGRAQQVFDKLSARNVISWSVLISGYAENGHGEIALMCYNHMQLEGVLPNAVTYVSSLNACGSIGAVDEGQEIHAQVEVEGLLERDAVEGLLERDAIVGEALLDMYARFGMFAKAQQVFDKLPNRTVISWTSLISRLFEHGHTKEAFNCFKQMQHKGVNPNEVTFVTMLKMCGSVGAIDKVQELHAEVERLDLLGSKFVGNTLVFVYSKCGALAFAHEVFDKLPVGDVVSWNSLILGYSQLGETEHALLLFDRMLGEGIEPGSVTFTTLLSACNRQGLLNRSQMYFQAMTEDYGILLAPEHQCGMVEAFCRSGKFEKAKSLIQSMESGSNAVMWHSFLGACRNFQNVDVGNWAFGQAEHLKEKDAASYALLAQVYGG